MVPSYVVGLQFHQAQAAWTMVRADSSPKYPESQVLYAWFIRKSKQRGRITNNSHFIMTFLPFKILSGFF